MFLLFTKACLLYKTSKIVFLRFIITIYDMKGEGVRRAYRRLRGITRGDKGLQRVTSGYKWLQTVTRDDRGLQGVTKCYMRLKGVTRGDRGLPGVRGGYKR